jgi:hypothetical protein
MAFTWAALPSQSKRVSQLENCRADRGGAIDPFFFERHREYSCGKMTNYQS